MTNLVVGRDLDALVAQHVFRMFVDNTVYYQGHCDDSSCCEGEPIPDYSTSIAAAWEVVEKMREMGFTIMLNDYITTKRNSWMAEFVKHPTFGVIHDAATAPLAICLAALKAVGYQSMDE